MSNSVSITNIVRIPNHLQLHLLSRLTEFAQGEKKISVTLRKLGFKFHTELDLMVQAQNIYSALAIIPQCFLTLEGEKKNQC